MPADTVQGVALEAQGLGPLAAPGAAPAPRPARLLLRRAAGIAGIWTVIVLLSIASESLSHVHSDEGPGWGRLFWSSAIYWYTIGIFTPVVLWLARRVPFGRGRPWRTTALYAMVLSVVFLLHCAVYAPARQLLYPVAGFGFGPMLRKFFFHELFIFSAMVAIAHALEYSRTIREREVRASQLEARLSRAQLDVLRSELQPHFFFNALHSISTLMHRNVDAADEMLTQLADLLRASMDRRSVQEVPLHEELAVLERYLKIMRTRFGDRLSISVAADPELLDVRVPVFILQPLVENAIQHGIAQRAGAGSVAIEARPAGESLELLVRDDGAGFSSNTVREGIGLSNCRLRLEQLYGPAGTLAIDNQPGRGTQVTLRVPRRTSRPGA